MSANPISSALTLGAITGMQSTMAPAVISWAARRRGLDLESTPFSAFQGKGIGKAAAALMMGEAAMGTPRELDASTLLTRAASGGAAGATVFRAHHKSMFLGAILGAAAAVGAAYAAVHIRKRAARRFQVSERTVALVEDGIALAAGVIAVSLINRADVAAIEPAEA